MYFFKPFKAIIAAALPFVATTLCAGQILLSNGDILQGELKSLEAGSILWSSEILGDIRIPKASVKQLDSDTVLPVVKTDQGYAEGCVVVIDDAVSTRCVEGSLDAGSLAEISSSLEHSDAVDFAGNVKLAYDRQEGNSDTEDLDFATTANWQYHKFRHNVELAAESDKSDGVIQSEKYEADYQLDYDFREHWFSYGSVGYEKDKFSTYEQQYELGGGIGHRYLFANMLQTEAQIGLAYLQSELIDGDIEKDIAGKWAFKLEWPIPDTNLSVFHRHELIWPLDDINNNQVETSTGLKMPLIVGVFSEFRYDFDYTAEVTEDTEHADQEWVISLGYQW